MFDKIFIERRVQDNPYTQNILNALSTKEYIPIDRVSDVFEKVRKPYLHKRTHFNVFIGKKEGVFLKEMFNAYGISRGRHFYFHHAYNCIYECQYCYLQGYFNSPDLVFFVNHDDILKSISDMMESDKDEEFWFHAGEFSDNLALSHYTREWGDYFDFFKHYPNSYLELRTKSNNIRAIENVEPQHNVIISYSLSSDDAIKHYDLKTPSLKMRIEAISKLSRLGFRIGIHLDPIIDSPNLLEEYEKMVDHLLREIGLDSIEYVSVGIIRFTKSSYNNVKKNYPNSLILNKNFVKKDSDKITYEEYKRDWIYRNIIDLFIKKGYNESRVYKCMDQ